MQDQPSTQIIIRHVGGAKVNKIEQFPLAAAKEITFGRDVRSTVAFDSQQDDLVSRKHAVLKVKSEDPLAFAVADLNSSNGTFVNGERITGEVEIYPEDKVALGSGGPEFIFDVQPRPASLAARTRVLAAVDPAATRVVAAAGASAAAATQKLPAKVGIGKNTVQMMLREERKKTSQVWMGAMGAVLAFVLVGGGVLYWHNASTAQRLQQDADEQRQKIALQQEQMRSDTSMTVSQQIGTVTQQLGLNPGEIISRFGNSTVYIDVRWRLYDKDTGRAVFHKTIEYEKKLLPAYVKLANGKIVRWLTIDDEERTNYEIGQASTGSGFVISEQGFVLTNKHVAAGWRSRFTPADNNATLGVLVSADKKGKIVKSAVDVSRTAGAEDLWRWVPEEDGGIVFASKSPVATNNANAKDFYGRNDILEVRFPGSRLSINAALVRSSTDDDVALIKVETPQPLTPLELSTDDQIKIGEKVIVLGYPGISTQTVAQFTTNELGRLRTRAEIIPEPTVTDGIVSRIGTETKTNDEGTMRLYSTRGDTFQLSVVATGPGNGGGPVFNAAGKVIGLFTAGSTSRDGTRVTHAVRIKHGLALLSTQKTQ